jgi:hypothetical protein
MIIIERNTEYITLQVNCEITQRNSSSSSIPWNLTKNADPWAYLGSTELDSLVGGPSNLCFIVPPGDLFEQESVRSTQILNMDASICS